MSNHTIVIPAADLEAATAFYRTAWGAEPHTETPYYVGFNLDGQEIGLNPHGERDQMAGPVVYWKTDDLAATVAAVEASGGTVVRPVTEVGGGTSLALLADPAGNQVGFITQG
jgi:lactoylglutathione lyase